MKKFSLLAAVVFTAGVLSSPGMTARAASSHSNWLISSAAGSPEVISYRSDCDLSSLFEQLKDCLPWLSPSIPKPELPQENSPELQNPGENPPGQQTPEQNPPGQQTPEQNPPGQQTPDNNLSDSDKPDEDSDASDENISLSYTEQIVKLVNAERAKANLSPLRISKEAAAAAQVRAMEIEISFSHTRPNGSGFATALKEQNLSYQGAGENLAWGQRSPKEVVDAWMNSQGHRENILNSSFTHIGVGYHQNASGIRYWSQLFFH